MEINQIEENCNSCRKELKNLESELIELVAKTNNQILMDKFLDCQNKRNSANELYIGLLEHLINHNKTEEIEPKLKMSKRISIRNINYFKTFAEHLMCDKNVSYTGDYLGEFIQKWQTYNDIDEFFDKFTIAFMEWYLKLNERTKEHSIEELLNDFKDEIALCHISIDAPKPVKNYISNVCESCGEVNCIC